MVIDNANLQIDEYEKHCAASYWLRASFEFPGVALGRSYARCKARRLLTGKRHIKFYLRLALNRY